MSKPTAAKFGKNVNRLRNLANLTQEQLSERADISRRYLQMIEAGKYVPTIEVASRLRMALKLTWDELLRGI
ncbi:MAG: helix-turn-helix domain-containing protein [Methylacidiphilales bacterium]|nr:helix-turn-helix domain-containing protein [Candidatus Methylacidiphilales bacterium]